MGKVANEVCFGDLTGSECAGEIISIPMAEKNWAIEPENIPDTKSNSKQRIIERWWGYREFCVWLREVVRVLEKGHERPGNIWTSCSSLANNNDDCQHVKKRPTER